jgi:hypothetical protein
MTIIVSLFPSPARVITWWSELLCIFIARELEAFALKHDAVSQRLCARSVSLQAKNLHHDDFITLMHAIVCENNDV